MSSKDNDLTRSLRHKLSGMKKESSYTWVDVITELVTAILFTIIKVVTLSAFVWYGYERISRFCDWKSIPFVEIIFVMVGLRAFTMFVIDPIFDKKKES
jgi:hypothetical protein